MKKIITLIIALMLITGIMAVPASAASVTGTVTLSSGSLNVRSQPDTTSTIIGRLSNGSKVTIVTNTNGFYKINYNGSYGYVYAQYVVNDQTAVIVNAAKSALGVKYVFGGSTMSGMDCSGLVLYCYKKIGLSLPHSAAQLSTMGYKVSRANLKKGDLVFFDTNGGNDGINHVGIYIGNGQVIQAQSGLGKVAQISLSNSYWSNAYMSARRFII